MIHSDCQRKPVLLLLTWVQIGMVSAICATSLSSQTRSDDGDASYWLIKRHSQRHREVVRAIGDVLHRHSVRSHQLSFSLSHFPYDMIAFWVLHRWHLTSTICPLSLGEHPNGRSSNWQLMISLWGALHCADRWQFVACARGNELCVCLSDSLPPCGNWSYHQMTLQYSLGIHRKALVVAFFFRKAKCSSWKKHLKKVKAVMALVNEGWTSNCGRPLTDSKGSGKVCLHVKSTWYYWANIAIALGNFFPSVNSAADCRLC